MLHVEEWGSGPAVLLRVTDCLDGAQLTRAVRAIASSIARVDRLAGVLEQLQLPMAEVRDALGIEGNTPARP